MNKQERPTIEEELVFALKAADATIPIMGSGRFVQLFIRIDNSTNKNIILEFPAGLIIKSRSGNYQNGVLLKKVRVPIAAKGLSDIVLLMFCGNVKKSSSSSSETYDWAVVSNSSLVVDLCNRLANKKINYEEFSKDKLSIFKSQLTDLQSAVWSVTDKNGLTEYNLKFIDGLPNSDK